MGLFTDRCLVVMRLVVRVAVLGVVMHMNLSCICIGLSAAVRFPSLCCQVEVFHFKLINY